MLSTRNFTCFDKLQIHQDLLHSISDCQIRGIVHSSTWLSELLLTNYHELAKFPQSADQNLANCVSLRHSGLTPEESVKLTLARSYFDTQEYSRCAHLMSSSVKTNCHQLVYFMYVYARYMAIEKNRTDNALAERKYWNWATNSDSTANMESYRKEMSDLKSDIENFYVKSSQVTESTVHLFMESGIDVYSAFIYALVRIRLGFNSMAIKLFVSIVERDPNMWPSWSELITLLESREQLDKLFPISNRGDEKEWMVEFFRAKALLRLHEPERALVILNNLASIGFQNSLNLQSDIATAYERLRDLETSMEHFKQVFSLDPYRLTDTDVFSNVLFVKGEHNELAYLARQCAKIDRYRPQTCCVLGNFYGLRGQHDKAVLYFQRALRLLPRYALVWTLIGHEYVELRHLKLALYAYNQAIIHNRQDHRAWYGLGQLYEFVKQLDHALYYYKRAQYLCPTDSRIIVALGEMYEALGNLNAARKCFWRAYAVGDLEGGALSNLARCFDKCGEESEAAAAYTKFIHQCDSQGVVNECELGQAYRYLANYHLKHNHLSDAVFAVNKCLDFPEIREEAKALCRQLTQLSGTTSTTNPKSKSPSSPSLEPQDEGVLQAFQSLEQALELNRQINHKSTRNDLSSQALSSTFIMRGTVDCGMRESTDVAYESQESDFEQS